MTTSNELADQVHILIHSMRLIPKYVPSLSEKKLNEYVIECFKDKCDECKSRGDYLKTVPQEQKGFFGRMMEAIKAN